MRDKARPWPPLVVASHMPALVKWRDAFLTLMMWILFALLLATEFELFVSRQLVRLGLGDFRTDPNWQEFFGRLVPFVQVALMLVGVLAMASLMTLHRRRRSLLLPPPPKLTLVEEAGRVGMEEPALADARQLRVCVVYIDEDGTHRVKVR